MDIIIVIVILICIAVLQLLNFIAIYHIAERLYGRDINMLMELKENNKTMSECYNSIIDQSTRNATVLDACINALESSQKDIAERADLYKIMIQVIKVICRLSDIYDKFIEEYKGNKMDSPDKVEADMLLGELTSNVERVLNNPDIYHTDFNDDELNKAIDACEKEGESDE